MYQARYSIKMFPSVSETGSVVISDDEDDTPRTTTATVMTGSGQTINISKYSGKKSKILVAIMILLSTQITNDKRSAVSEINVLCKYPGIKKKNAILIANVIIIIKIAAKWSGGIRDHMFNMSHVQFLDM